MTAFDFPSSPTYGQTYQAYTWDGVKWYSTLGGTGDAAPSPPAILTGLIGWWDASVFASMSLTGTNINSIADQSGNSQTMPWIGFAKPIYAATGFNGSRPTMTFNSTTLGNALGKASFPMGTGNTLTCWYVGTAPQSGAVGSYGRVMGYAPSGTDDFSVAGGWNLSAVTTQTDRMAMQRASTSATATGISAYPAGHRIIVTINSSGLMTVYVDGVSGGTATSAGNWGNNGTLCIGCQPGNSAGFWGGMIAECGVATGFSNSTVVGQLDTYLKNKWGL